MSGQLPVAVIGAGPVGLAAASHLVERGESPVIFEMSETVAGNIRSWEHVRVFSTWSDNVDKAARRLLEADGWVAPPGDGLPTGRDLIDDYLKPLSELAPIAAGLHLGTKVTGISRSGHDKVKTGDRSAAPFVIQTLDRDGNADRYEARAVIDASGTWANPNPIGASGMAAIGEGGAASRIFYGIPDVLGKDTERYQNRRVMVVGSGHSAFQALLDLARLQQDYPDTTVHWVLRSRPSVSLFGGGEHDELAARGALGQALKKLVLEGVLAVHAPFQINRIIETDGSLEVVGRTEDGARTLLVDEIIGVTGSRPDLEMLRELRVDIDPALEGVAKIAPMIDPNVHSCGTVDPHGEADLRQPEKDFYIVGNKSYGRAPTFLMMTGYEQVRSVVAALTGDMEAAGRVELVLPDTGVDFVGDEEIYDLDFTTAAS